MAQLPRLPAPQSGSSKLRALETQTRQMTPGKL